ncbi:hypothetical protein ACHWQZ_G012598 [Mnemiopsis leidyi]
MLILVLAIFGVIDTATVFERPQYPPCAIPLGWEDELVVAPSPRNNFVKHSYSVVVMCKEPGYTFINDIYKINGVYASAIFFDSAITVACKYGTLAPSLFLNRTSWCDRGCPKAPTDSYTAVYGNISDPRAYLLQAEADRAPVYPQPMELIRFKCNAGYTELYQDKGSPWVRCNEGGYDRIPIHCVAGCDYPKLTPIKEGDSAHVFDPEPQITSVKDPPYSIGFSVTVLCNGNLKKSAIVKCTENIGWVGSLDWNDLECRYRGIVVINGVSAADVFFYSYILITCRDGSLQPNIFLQTRWCDKGCTKFPENYYKVSYGFTTQSRKKNPLRQYGKLQAPVSANPLYVIEVSCQDGYTTVVGDNGSKEVRCTETGYNTQAIVCSAGCDIPFNVDFNLLNKSALLPPNNAGSGKAAYPTGTHLTVDCNKRFEGNTVVTMVCEAGKGWSGIEDLKVQQDGQCSAGYVPPVVNSTSNSTQTGSTATKTGFRDMTDKSCSLRGHIFSQALFAFYTLVVVCM